MGDAPETRYRRYWENLARRIEPELKGDPARLAVYLDFFRREIVRDSRVFSFKVAALRADGTTMLAGSAEYREQVDALVRLLDTLNLGPMQNDIEIAPTAMVGDRPFAVVRAAGTFLRADPDDKSETVNQALSGEPLFLIDVTPDGRRYLCHSTDGYVGWVLSEDIELVSRHAFTEVVNSRVPSRGDLVEIAIDDALRRQGAKYVWGGRSREGLDCSGLVQQAYAAAGINLPRDAEQQALVGRLVAMRHYRDALKRGDVLFFLGRRGFIAHTGIYLGDGKFIESADGGVKISEFNDDENRNRREDTFCFAKRILD